ncbi:hypothetical protein VCM39_21480 [Bacteroides sp. CG01]|uniref:hypothetical protein n=1 Tax=Bacteroides sp. CG01 TaxID=3096000 RepID=UPI002AFF72BA|nr:hypothetical protein [Bacteroides sp. CG01]
MRKLKRIFLIIFSVLLVCGILQQLYYRVKYEGNLVFYITNESPADPARLEIFIDGIKVVDDKIRSVFQLVKQYSVKTTLGNHVITVKIDGEFIEEIKLNTFLVTFVSVEYYGDILDSTDKYRKYFYIGVHKSPMLFIA